MKYEFRRPTVKDAEYLAAHLKRDNAEEVAAVIGDNALLDILNGMAVSTDIGCCLADGKVLAIYGVIRDSVISDSGQVWLLFSDEAERHRYFIGRRTKSGLEQILGTYGRVYNWVNIGNTEIIKWLKWLGAKMQGPLSHGFYGQPHYYFEFTKKE